MLKAKLGVAPIAWWNDDAAPPGYVSLAEALRSASVAGVSGMETSRRFAINMQGAGRSSRSPRSPFVAAGFPG